MSSFWVTHNKRDNSWNYFFVISSIWNALFCNVMWLLRWVRMLYARAACVLLVNNIKVLKLNSYLKVKISPSKRWQNLSGSMRGVLVLESRQPRPKNCLLTALDGHTRAPSYYSHSTWLGPAKLVTYETRLAPPHTAPAISQCVLDTGNLHRFVITSKS